MKTRVISIVSMFGFLVIGSLSSCSSGPYYGDVKVASLTISEKETVIDLGSTHNLAAIFNPSYANIGTALSWSSENSAIAAVNSEGVVSPAATGKTRIIVESENGKKEACDVIVRDPNNPIESESIAFRRSKYSVIIGSKIELDYSIMPINANSDIDVSFSVFDPSVINLYGNIAEAKKLGMTTVTATTKNGLSSTIVVEVVEKATTPGFSISPIAGETDVKVAKNLDEASTFVNNAILKHQNSLIVKFDFESNLSLASFSYSYRDTDMWTRLDIGKNIEGNPDTLGYSTKQINIIYNGDSKVASTITEVTPANSYKEIPNASTTLRNNWIKSSAYARPYDFNNYPIDTFNSGEVAIQNSEELYSAVQRGYKPVFNVDGTRAEYYYNHAKSILQQICSKAMSDLQKAKAIFDWMCENTNYNYDSIAPYLASSDVASNIEGVFDEGYAVCNGFSKTYALMCGIENVPCYRGCGTQGGSGHAWNYIQSDEDSNWYLVCPTWGQKDTKVSTDNFYGENYTFTAYNAFATKKSFFKDASDGSFSPNTDAFSSITGSMMTYFQNLLSYEKLYSDFHYDFQIDSQAELNAVVKASAEAMGEQDYIIEVQMGDMGTLFTQDFTQAVNAANIGVARCSFKQNTLYTTYYYIMVNY